MRKVKYGIIILLNYIYVPLKCILSGFHFHATLPQLITPGTKIEMGGGWPYFLAWEVAYRKWLLDFFTKQWKAENREPCIFESQHYDRLQRFR